MVAHVLELGHQLVPQLLVNNRHLAFRRNYEYADEYAEVYKGFVKGGRIFKWKSWRGLFCTHLQSAFTGEEVSIVCRLEVELQVFQCLALYQVQVVVLTEHSWVDKDYCFLELLSKL